MACQNKCKKASTTTPSATETRSEQPSIPAIAVPDTERNDVELASIVKKHRITIIDFWASWCGPCMQEMPNIKQIWGQYSGKGLGIVGISLDSDFHRWTDAINNNGMAWTQLSELRGWDSYAAKTFKVTAIPHTIVVDDKGKVLAVGLRGEQLAQFIAAQLSR